MMSAEDGVDEEDSLWDLNDEPKDNAKQLNSGMAA